MNVIVTGATGMVGQGVLRECLMDPGVMKVLALGRASTEKQDPKLEELVHQDLFNLEPVEDRLQGYDACFFCLGVSSAGMSEADYTRVTYDLTLAIARTLSRLNPQMTFIYVSGAGTDTTAQGRTMWARVKGRTENALLELPFKAAYMFRPALIRPLHGVRAKTPLYRAFYAASAPLMPLLAAAAPKYVTDSEKLGKAMLKVAREGAPQKRLENHDINALVGA